MTDQQASILLFDGDCGICREWVAYWRGLTGERVEYKPYQDVVDDYTDITAEDVTAAIHLIEPDNRISKGAEATYRLYQGINPQSLLLVLYRYLPGFRSFSEFFYRFLSTHRGLLAFITHLLWGRNFQPPHYQLISNLFLRLLGVVYFIAFVSFFVQAGALIGADGVLPLEYYLNAVSEQLGTDAYYRLPTLFWFSHSDAMINAVCLAGMVFSLILVAGYLRVISLICMYVLYLSLVNGGQVFMSFQWDALLLECGFLAIFLPWGSTLIVWCYRWLVFRFMFLGGLVKLASGDKSWESLTALNYHFETQPLPTPLAWYAHHLPEGVLMAATALTLVIELLMVFLIFTPRNFRHVAGICFISLQMIILLTGNYNFFNLLTICMCLFLFDDVFIKNLLPGRLVEITSGVKQMKTGIMATGCAGLMLFISLYMGSTQINSFFSRDRDREFSAFYRLLIPFSIVNAYGPFAIMTTKRHEIVIEGSADKNTWQEYEFKYKPGNLAKCPGWVEPHQPRIDWQMWFAVLSNPEKQRWLFNLLVRLLQNSEPVKAIFSVNPFPDEAPVSVRARVYLYTFTSPEERRETGRCWNRSLVAAYYPPVSIRKR